MGRSEEVSFISMRLINMDLLKVGVALVGVALLIIALVALAFYLDVRGRMGGPQVPFSASAMGVCCGVCLRGSEECDCG